MNRVNVTSQKQLNTFYCALHHTKRSSCLRKVNNRKNDFILMKIPKYLVEYLVGWYHVIPTHWNRLLYFFIIFYFLFFLFLVQFITGDDCQSFGPRCHTKRKKKDWGPRFISQRHLISLVFKSSYKCDQTDTLPLTNTSNLFIARKGKKRSYLSCYVDYKGANLTTIYLGIATVQWSLYILRSLVPSVYL